MVEALAPRISRGWLALVLLVALPAPAFGQAAKAEPGKAAAKKADPPAKADDAAARKAEAPDEADAEKGVVDKANAEKQETTEVFDDPRAKPLLEVKSFREFPDARPPWRPNDYAAMKNMAANVVSPNRETINRFLDQTAADLTKHDYIRAVMDPNAGGGPDKLRGLENASQQIMDVINTAKGKKNGAFLALFIPQLFAKLTPLLEGHLLSRIEASIILASAATRDQVDLFVKQVNDPKQVIWVKHWAAVGLTNATDQGRSTLAINQQTAAVQALLNLLQKEPSTPWPVKIRVLQALGSIHLASTEGVQGKPDVAGYAFTVLTDPSAKPDLRAWAAWCLGMLAVPGGQPFNYKLAGYEVGRLAADLGDGILADYDQHAKKFTSQNDLSRRLTALLIYEVYPALAGEEGIGNTGFLHIAHPGTAAARPFLTGLEAQLRKVGSAANDLLAAAGNLVKQERDDLAAEVAALKKFLDQNRPGANDTELFPGGPKVQPKPGGVPVAPARR